VTLPVYARLTPAGLELRLKVVPGASRSAVAGPLGDRLEVRVAAAPEDGKANRAVCALLAGWSSATDVRLLSGATGPEKTVLLVGCHDLPRQ
jgi:uncharacterized protein (TIGR00251 family)